MQYVSQTGMEEKYMNHYHQSCPYISFQDSFPQIRKGNFRFNGNRQSDFDSFLQLLTKYTTRDYLLDKEDAVLDEEDDVLDEEDDVLDEEDDVLDEEDAVLDEEDDVLDEEDDLRWTSQPSEYLQEPPNGSVQPSGSHSRIRSCLIV
eukprot:XP_011661547.1 PREDICTED: uncharacterized protein LOC100892568 [Strongylocentrotus purpuratus]